jgi:hypothetical protein
MPTMDATACAVATTASSVAGPRLARHGTADATGDATGVAGEDDPFPEGGPGPAQGWRFQGVGPLLPEGVQVRVNGQPGWLERCDARMEGGLAGVPWLDGSAASYAPVVMPRVQVKYRVRMADMADVRAAMAGTDGLAARVAERAGRAAMVASVKAASEVYAPVSGEIIAVNDSLPGNPGTVNQSPLKDGWFFKVKIKNPSEVANLMDEAEYKAYLAAK